MAGTSGVTGTGGGVRRAVILAAGRGARMGELSDARPKCLTPLAGRALLDWQCDALRAAGVIEIAVVRGYRGEQLARPGLASFENPRWATTNMVRSLLCAAPWLARETCIVAYGDIVYHPDTVAALAAADADLAIAYDRLWRALWRERFDDPAGDAESFRVDAQGRVVDIGRPRPRLDATDGQYMGLLRIAPAAFAHIARLVAALDGPAGDRLDMTSLLRALIAAGQPVLAVPVDGRWCEVDRESDVRLYERRAGEAWSHDWRP
ncbi:MAG: phosphocholine cytidylyltransferase family protein [bacterium]|nr:phosphocholine cytidylyltransferase family protein [bacterium]